MVDIFYETLRVAEIQSTDAGIEFVYAPEWISRRSAFPISLALPLRGEAYPQDRILPWLTNLLPESHLTEIGQRIGVSPQDVIGLLLNIGRDTAGAFAIGRPRLGKDAFRPVAAADDLERIIDELPSRPFLVGQDGVSMSLAGAQDKLGVAMVDGRIAIPIHGTPSTHILKPDIKALKGSVQNEAFCLTLADLVGLPASKVTTGRAGARYYLLVERYDRIVAPQGIRRIHQEDLAQILGIFPKDKYEFDGLGRRNGPGLKDLFRSVQDNLTPGSRLILLDSLIFNVICCNSDAHAKNYSILIGAGGSTKMAPLYDVLCSEVWPRISRTLPQRLGERTRGADVHGSDWQMLAREVGLNVTRTCDRVEDLCLLVRRHAVKARMRVAEMPAGDHQMLHTACFHVQKRAERLLRQLTVKSGPSRKPPGGRSPRAST